VDAHREAALLNPVDELRQVAGKFADPGKGIGAREKKGALFLQTHDVEGRHVSARLAIDHEIARGSEAIEIGFEGVFADSVEDDVYAAIAGNAARFLGNIGARGDNDFVGAGFANEFGFSSVDVTPMTRPPRILAIWQSSSPTPPAAAWTRHQSPGLTGYA